MADMTLDQTVNQKVRHTQSKLLSAFAAILLIEPLAEDVGKLTFFARELLEVAISPN